MGSDTQRWLAKVNVLPSELVKKETPAPDRDLAEYAMLLQNYMATVEGELVGCLSVRCIVAPLITFKRRPKGGETHQPSQPSNAKSQDIAAREPRTSCGDLDLAKNCPDVFLHSKPQDKQRIEGRDGT